MGLHRSQSVRALENVTQAPCYCQQPQSILLAPGRGDGVFEGER